MCELLVGLPAVTVLGIVDEADGPLWVHIETRTERPRCAGCGGPVVIKERPLVDLVDLPAFGRPARLVWRKNRWRCCTSSCPVGSWTEAAPAIAAARLVMTDRAGRWVTEQVGRWRRTVNEVAVELDCDWHTVNDTVIAYGTALVDDYPGRIGVVTALGLDETLFTHQGPWRRQLWCTSIVDVRAGRLVDITDGRRATEPCAWLARRGDEWLGRIEFATLDLSGPYRTVFDTMVPDAVQVADPFPLVKLANTTVDECRRRVQTRRWGTEAARPTRSTDVVVCSPRPTSASTRVAAPSFSACCGPVILGETSPPPGTPRRRFASSTSTLTRTSPRLGHAPRPRPAGLRLPARGPPARPQHHPLATPDRRLTQVSNGPTEAVNNLVKRIKRVAFGLSRFRNYRIRTPLYAGRPNWGLLATITPR